MFPAWKYHRQREARIVHSAEELASLGEGWADSPGELGIITAPSREQAEMLDEPMKRRPGRPKQTE